MVRAVKEIVRYTALLIGMLIAFPFGLLSFLEKYTIKTDFFFSLGGHCMALIPGVPGNFVRAAYYILTLDYFHPTGIISFGSYFSRRQARVGAKSGCGAYCIIGMANIGKNVRLASKVSVISGLHEHGGSATSIENQEDDAIERQVIIGDNCWIGEGAMIGANVGADCVVGVGAVVIKAIPDGSFAMGNPARQLPPQQK